MLDSLSPFRFKSNDFDKLNFYQFFLRRFGIGYSISNWICKFTGLHPFLKLFNILDSSFDSIYSNYYLLKRIKFFFLDNKDYLDYLLSKKKIDSIKLLRSTGSLRGRNHVNALPVRGQRRRTNARTRKKIRY
jgi:ribosomal protein S13